MTRAVSGAVALLLLVVTLAACAPSSGVDASGTLRVTPMLDGGVWVVRIPAGGVGRPVAVRRSLFQSMLIPRGHAPPPSLCRIWYHDRAPSLQPPVGPCPELERLAPQGAYLVYG